MANPVERLSDLSRNLITRMSPPVLLSWPRVTRPSRVTDAALDGRVKPGHDTGAKFTNVFMASFAGGDIRVIKSRKRRSEHGTTPVGREAFKRLHEGLRNALVLELVEG